MKILKIMSAVLFSSLIANAEEIYFDRMPSLNEITEQASEQNDFSAPNPPLIPPLTKGETWGFNKAENSKDWTIMIFMNGKNDLANFALQDLNEMEQVVSTDRINVVVEAGRINYTPPSNPYPYYPDYPDVYPWGGVPHWGIHPHYHPPPALNMSSKEARLFAVLMT